MSAGPAVPARAAAPQAMRGLTWVLAVACGLIVANLYYAQPLVSQIARQIQLAPAAAGFIVTCTQIGYCLGLVLLVPLGDLVENRRLAVSTVSVAGLALLVAAVADSSTVFLLACWVIGLGSVAVQMLVPIAAALAPSGQQGRVVGNVMAGLLSGIMLARPVSSLLASLGGWRLVYFLSAGVMALVALALRWSLPTRRPSSQSRSQSSSQPSYPALIASLATLLRDTPILRWRAAYQAVLFGVFSLYWTAVPLLLASPAYGLSLRGIAWFSLAGAAGAIAAPIAGRLADRGVARLCTLLCMLLAVLAFALSALATHGSMACLLAGAIVLDFSVQANLVFGQRSIFALGESVRSRLNGLYLALFFAGGALGSALAGLAYAHGRWPLVCALGAGFALMGLGLVVLGWRQDRSA